MPGDDAESNGPAPSDAFQALGNETRMGIVRSLSRTEPATFTSLFEASEEDTSAGFAYHLRQLDDLFVRSDEDEYELTNAGRAVARAIRAGTFTDSVDRSPTALDERCPFCDEQALEAVVTDNVTDVRCAACDAPLLDMSFPPSGYATRDTDELPGAFDAYHRLRIRSFAAGVCPDCGASVTTSIDRVPAKPGVEEELETEAETERPLVSFACDGCGLELRCPVALTVLDHPSVVSFYHDHSIDVGDRPIWNVGPEWREQLVSTDPTCIRVTTRLTEPGEVLHLYVAEDLRVVDHRREGIPDDGGRTPPDEVAS